MSGMMKQHARVARVQVLGPGMAPPPSTVNCSCVYVVRRGDGYFYCGESDDIKGAPFSLA